MKERFYIDETNSETGPVVRWNSNDQIPFEDKLQEFFKLGYITNQELENSIVTRQKEVAKFLSEYSFTPTTEDIAEMKSVFGDGAVVVDVFSGKNIQL